MGSYVLDYIAASRTLIRDSVSTAARSKDLLFGIMLSLSRLNGAQASLLPSLLERSKDFLTLQSCLTTSPVLDVQEDDTEEIVGGDFYEQNAEGIGGLQSAGGRGRMIGAGEGSWG